MYQPHPSFESVDDNTKIWRYMDFAKFCSLLEKQALFFTKPSFFDDPWEGHLPQKNLDDMMYGPLSEGEVSGLVEISKQTSKFVREKWVAVNCWHMGNYESEALWRNYSERGVVIQSTFKRLKDCFEKSEPTDFVFVGVVEYKDHETEIINRGNLFNQVLWKRKSFEYERELRAVTVNALDDSSLSSKGKDVPVNLNTLIECVYTTPFLSDSWFNELVCATIKRHGFNFLCKQSNLMKKP